MKTIVIILSSILLCSCEPRQWDAGDYYSKGYRIEVIDGCEYVVVENSCQQSSTYSLTITHKGDCKNQAHLLR